MNFQNLINLTDSRTEFHPEPTVAHHVALVALRAMLVTGDRDVVLAALVHDLFKPSRDHAQLGADWLQTDEGRFWVWQRRGNLQTVTGLVLDHMNLKFGMPTRARTVPFSDLFPVLDDMVGRHALPERKSFHRLPEDGGVRVTHDSVHFCGLSVTDQMRDDGNFTISFTEERFPISMRWEDIPAIFEAHLDIADLASDVSELLHLN